MLCSALSAAARLIVFVFISTIGLASASTAQDGKERPQILIVVESDSRLPFVRLLLAGIEEELGPEFTTRSEIYVEYLDMLRFDDPAELEANRNFMVQRYRPLGVDALMVLGANALAFVLSNRKDIAPTAPIVYGGFGEAGLKDALSGQTRPDVSGVISQFDVQSTLDLAMTVQPEAPEIIVIAGSGRFDRQWRSAFNSVVSDRYRDVPVRFLPESSVDDYLFQAKSFDPGAIVFLLSLNLDSKGRRFLPVQFAQFLAEASAAPVWSPYETQIGKGIVGGTVEDLTATGRELGKFMRIAVAGSPLPAPVRVTAVPTVDWRVMQRFGLELDLLPGNTRVLFHDPGLWEKYRFQTLTILTIVAAQAATILGLMFQRRRFLRSQMALSLERSQLIHVSRNMRLGQLSASLAHEINQPLAAIQANAEAGSRISGRVAPDAAEIGAIFRDITEDVQRAGATIAGLRRLIVKGEIAMEPLDLNEIVRATLPLVRNELDACDTKVELRLSPSPIRVNGNSAQLQQVVLNLILNASEAMNGGTKTPRALTLTTGVQTAGRVALIAEDTGPGVPPDRREEAFRPFVSTKASGLGVGLAICRNIAEAHGGSLAFVDPEGAGARIVLSLPEAVT